MRLQETGREGTCLPAAAASRSAKPRARRAPAPPAAPRNPRVYLRAMYPCKTCGSKVTLRFLAASGGGSYERGTPVIYRVNGSNVYQVPRTGVKVQGYLAHKKIPTP